MKTLYIFSLKWSFVCCEFVVCNHSGEILYSCSATGDQIMRIAFFYGTKCNYASDKCVMNNLLLDKCADVFKISNIRMFFRCSSTLFQKLLHLTNFSIDCKLTAYSFICEYYTNKCFICSFIQIETWYYFILLLLYYIAQLLYQEKYVKTLDIVSLQVRRDSTFKVYKCIRLWNNENILFIIGKLMHTTLYIW